MYRTNKLRLTFLFLSFLSLIFLSQISTPVLAALPTATLSFDPSSSTIAPGSNSTLKIKISAAERLAGFEFQLQYDPAVVKINSPSDVSLGSFLGSSGRSTSLLPSDINNTTGTAWVGAYSTGTQSGATGNGTLLSITFKAQNPGTSTLRLQNVLLSTSDDPPQIQPASANNSSITVGSKPTSTPTPTRVPTPTSTPTPTPATPPPATPTPGGPTPTPKPSVSPTPAPVPGDANGDKKVDFLDFVILLGHLFSQTNQGSNHGDFNSDGSANGLDYIIWLLNFGL